MALDDEAPERPERGVPPSSLYAGSGDVELEVTISKLRSSMMRAIEELDQFCISVREAKVRVQELKDALDAERGD